MVEYQSYCITLPTFELSIIVHDDELSDDPRIYIRYPMHDFVLTKLSKSVGRLMDVFRQWVIGLHEVNKRYIGDVLIEWFWKKITNHTDYNNEEDAMDKQIYELMELMKRMGCVGMEKFLKELDRRCEECHCKVYNSDGFSCNDDVRCCMNGISKDRMKCLPCLENSDRVTELFRDPIFKYMEDIFLWISRTKLAGGDIVRMLDGRVGSYRLESGISGIGSIEVNVVFEKNLRRRNDNGCLWSGLEKKIFEGDFSVFEYFKYKSSLEDNYNEGIHEPCNVKNILN